MSNLKRKLESELNEASPEKRTKFDAGRKYLLTPQQRQKRAAALARLACLEKEPTSNLDKLPSECILQVMYHMDLPKGIPTLPENPGTSALWNFIDSTRRAYRLWHGNMSSVLTGMQEKQYPQFLAMFGIVGRETEEQLHNLRCAIETQWVRGLIDDCNDWHQARQCRIGNPQLYRLNILIFLDDMTRYLDGQLRVLQKHGCNACHRFSKDTVERALLTLWRMGWRNPNRPGQWARGTYVDAKFDVDRLASLFHQQTVEVRSCIRKLLSFVRKQVHEDYDLEGLKDSWVCCLLALRPDATEEMESDIRQWVSSTVEATALVTTIIFGPDEALKMGTILEDQSDADRFMNYRFDELYEWKVDELTTSLLGLTDSNDVPKVFEERESYLRLLKVLEASNTNPTLTELSK